MILLDANILLYAVNRDLPQHKKARACLEQVLSDGQRVGLPWVVILAFLRLATNPRVFERPLGIEQAMAYMSEWLSQPTVMAVGPGPGHWPVLCNLLHVSGAGGNLTTDAHIAALAIEYGYAVYSTDYDFRRFAGLRHVNPLEIES